MSRFQEEIKKYLKLHKEIKAIGFDVFNTVLLRYVHSPEDIFYETGKKLKLPEGITAEEYKYIRQQVQRNIQREKEVVSGSAEVALEEIVEAMPVWLADAADMLCAEISAEKELCFFNPEWNTFLGWLTENDYKVFYISDMYLSAVQIEEILKAASAPIYTIYVSSQYGVNKKSGKLFEKVLEEEKLDATQIIHIGDNLEADVLGAERCGITSFFYEVTDTDPTQGLTMEEYVLGKHLLNKNALRHVAAYCVQCEDENLQKWYALGAQILGPLMAYFTEWLSKQVVTAGISKILFMMREGSFLRKAWHIYSRYANIRIEDDLLYVSRQALLLPSMEKFGEEELIAVLEAPQISVAEVLAVLHVTQGVESFEPYMKVQRKAFETTFVGEKNLYHALKDFLLSEDNVQTIETHIENEKKKAQKYLNQVYTTDCVATVDIGYQGTIQKRLEKVMPTKKWNHYLLLCNGQKRLDDLDSTNIKGALGTYCGEESDLMSVVNRNNRSLELLFLEGCGSTVGYEEAEGVVNPILGTLNWPCGQYEQIEACQEGALQYLELYCQSVNKRAWTQRELLQLLHRLLSHPSYHEASMLGNLIFDENNGTGYSGKICEDRDVSLIKELGADLWQQNTDYKEVQWVEGLLSLGDRSSILRCGQANTGYNESYALMLVNRLLAKNIDGIYIVAAGVVGRLVLKYAKMVNIHVVAFVDNNPNLQGKTIGGIPVIQWADCDDKYTYVIASIPYREELKAQLIAMRHSVGMDIVD